MYNDNICHTIYIYIISTAKYQLYTFIQYIRNIEVIKSNKGGLKVIHDCYMYTKKMKNNNSIRLECSSRKAKSCKGGITNNLEINDILNITPHSHPVDELRVNSTKARMNLKAAVTGMGLILLNVLRPLFCALTLG